MAMKDPEHIRNSGDQILKMLFGSLKATRLQEGLYQINHFSFDTLISKNGGNLREHDDWENIYSIGDWGDDDYISGHGVCDSPEQFMEKVGRRLQEEKDAFCVSLTKISKATEPSEGGWRWHKWGPYIGEHEPQCEYLYDEPEIESVYVYSIFRKSLPPSLRKGNESRT